jgi:hypothetical protein
MQEPAGGAGGAARKDGAANKDKDEAEQKARQQQEERKKKQEELRDKRRELGYAKIERQVAELDRRMRKMTVDAAVERAADALARARTELQIFQAEVKPRQLEERRISLDGASYRAEHSKDELGELTAMYDADEFARTTKELVLKRGRRDLEMAERRLAVERKEAEHFERQELPERERELQRKVADAELEHRKAELELEKARIEMDLGAQKAADRESDLAEQIADLEKDLEKGEGGS